MHWLTILLPLATTSACAEHGRWSGFGDRATKNRPDLWHNKFTRSIRRCPKRPKRIILIRHGNSEGNAGRERYATIPDHSLNLTPEGTMQALDAGQEIKQLIGEESVRVYLSPYIRTRQTY